MYTQAAAGGQKHDKGKGTKATKAGVMGYVRT